MAFVEFQRSCHEIDMKKINFQQKKNMKKNNLTKIHLKIILFEFYFFDRLDNSFIKKIK